MTKIAGVAIAAAAAALLLAACSGTSQPAATHNPSPSPRPSASERAVLEENSAEMTVTARQAAEKFLSLYSGRQSVATWQFIDPGLRKRISETTWVGVHRACSDPVAGTTYKLSMVGPASSVTVFAVSPRVGHIAQIAFLYGGGSRWWYDPSDGWLYFDRTLPQALAVAKAKRLCP